MSFFPSAVAIATRYPDPTQPLGLLASKWRPSDRRQTDRRPLTSWQWSVRPASDTSFVKRHLSEEFTLRSQITLRSSEMTSDLTSPKGLTEKSSHLAEGTAGKALPRLLEVGRDGDQLGDLLKSGSVMQKGKGWLQPRVQGPVGELRKTLDR